MVLLASWLTSRQCYNDRIVIFVVILCSLLVVLFCSLEDSTAKFKVSFSDGVFALMMSASLAFFTVHSKRFLHKVCIYMQVLGNFFFLYIEKCICSGYIYVIKHVCNVSY